VGEQIRVGSSAVAGTIAERGEVFAAELDVASGVAESVGPGVRQLFVVHKFLA